MDPKEYKRIYARQHKVECYPKKPELEAIRDIHKQKPEMSRSGVITYLIGLGIKTHRSKNNY